MTRQELLDELSSIEDDADSIERYALDAKDEAENVSSRLREPQIQAQEDEEESQETIIALQAEVERLKAERDSLLAEQGQTGAAVQTPKTARDVLNIIDDFLLNQIDEEENAGVEGKRLWCILSALRGPDHDDEGGYLRKLLTTSRIRVAAFPKTGHSNYGWTIMGDLSLEPLPTEKEVHAKLAGSSLHFRDHVNWAIQALNGEDIS